MVRKQVDLANDTRVVLVADDLTTLGEQAIREGRSDESRRPRHEDALRATHRDRP